ncbi:MAG: caspase family protein [Rhodospirillales bacterium]|nr:caspase family protein [Rhodospirillales bacterium]
MRHICVVTILAPLVLVAVAGCQTVQYSDSVQATRLNTGGDTETTSNVLANAGEWRNSGVMVERGHRYRIRAEGRWQAAPTCVPTGPEGEGMYGLLCPAWDIGRVLVGHPHQKLIGKIGETGAPFPIGVYRELTADRDGTLFLNMNEEFAGVSDNGGSLTVRVSLDAPSQPVVARAPSPPPPPPPQRTAQTTQTAQTRFSETPVAVTFKPVAQRPDDIAVIIGNADYARHGNDVPNVDPAYADAAGFMRYVTRALGVREGNVIQLRDATGAQMARVFGTSSDHRGQLYDWVVPGVSKVWIYYAGHGAPAANEGTSYLVPVDADGSRIQLSGYSLDTLYRNLGQLPAKSTTVVLEACFSGASQAGTVIDAASAIYARPRKVTVPSGVTVISAGAPQEVASWEKNKAHSLFTKYYLMGMGGEADKNPYGNGDGQVTYPELAGYLQRTMTYYARRYYGRDQTAQIVVGGTP